MTDNERRERYARALYSGLNWDIMDSEHRDWYYQKADEVLTVADSEIEESDMVIRRERNKALNQVAELRTELAAQNEVIARKDREFATAERLLRESYEEKARLRTRVEKAESLLARIRKVLDHPSVPDKIRAAVRED